MKCGSPIAWAIERAWATAEAEQQLRSASFSGSDHSSRVTAAVSPSASAQERRHRAVHPPAHGDEGLRAGRCGDALSPAHRGAQRARQRVGRELGRVQLARAEPAQLVGDLARADARSVEHRGAPDQRDDRAPGGGGGATATGVEPGVGHAVAVDLDRKLDLIAAGEASDGGGERVRRAAAAALR